MMSTEPIFQNVYCNNSKVGPTVLLANPKLAGTYNKIREALPR
jgi:hypothetical protein